MGTWIGDLLLKRVILGFVLGLLPLVSESASNEAALRAAFVFKFIKFIEWPNQSTNPSLRLCVLGAGSDVKEALNPLNGQPISKHIVDGNFVAKQAIELIYLDDSAGITQHLKTCQLVYRPIHAAPLSIPSPLPPGVLLVADDPAPGDSDIGIALARSADGRIEFSISTAAVTQSGVNISSQLLKLAKNSHAGGS
jgi:hypothetical protein